MARAPLSGFAAVALVMGVTASLAFGPTSALAETASPPLSPLERRLLLATLPSADAALHGGLDDVALAAAIQRRARAEAGLRVRPSAVDRFWALEPLPRDMVKEFEAARQEASLSQWLAALAPTEPRYRSLLQARDRYRAICARGGWEVLPEGLPLKEGALDPIIPALRVRLAAEGYVVPVGREADRFDAALAVVLAQFQARHGLAADGVLGRVTRAALDMPATARLAQIELNLERWRWAPRQLPADRIELDIAGAEAVLYRAGQPRLSMRAVVGAPATKTPMFASRLEAVVFNPPWNVPASIASREIAPKAARDPTYLSRHHYVITPNGLQQLAGPDNALGRLKFDLPSPFGVYLHDTPSQGAFARPMRALSHGCMRLEKPLELATALLAEQGWTRAQVDSAVATGTTRRVSLAQPTPLFVVYRTAFVDEAGQAQFRPDVYGWDEELSGALLAAP
jgi:murein L,D-transpeptidase YcbB/YkuD